MAPDAAVHGVSLRKVVLAMALCSGSASANATPLPSAGRVSRTGAAAVPATPLAGGVRGGEGGGGAKLTGWEPPRGRQLTGLCVTVEKKDSYGDGWNGAVYTLENSEGVSEATGTLDAGSSGTDELCVLSGGCYTMTVSAGSYPTEVSWSIIVEGAAIVGEGGAPSTVTICFGVPTSVPTTSLPTSTFLPTWAASADYKGLSALYTGTCMAYCTPNLPCQPKRIASEINLLPHPGILLSFPRALTHAYSPTRVSMPLSPHLTSSYKRPIMVC